MGDLGDYWRDVKPILKAERDERRERYWNYAIAALTEAGISFKESSDTHLIVTAPKCVIDYWPTTGLFIRRDTKQKGRGIKKLLKLCKQEGATQ